ncbi:RmlC-like cupin domain containing protein [Naviculisporaceae sp. PSN 640]
MAALLPIISELLPMIMPASISVTKASDVFPPEFLPASSDIDADPTREQQANSNGNGHINGATVGSSNEKKPPRTRNGNGIKIISRDAIVNKTDKMCATVLIIPPNSSSTIRHNGEQDAIIYAASGTGILLSKPVPQPVQHPLSQGDFAFIPAWTEHQARNDSPTEPVIWVVVRSGGSPVEVNLTDWGGETVEEQSRDGSLLRQLLEK